MDCSGFQMRTWIVCSSICLMVMACQADPLPADAMARPARPKSFASPDDLRTYLNQLGQYYAVAGRPR
ncbi:unnamed protein product [Nezara viridula]|uniref:Neuropeptide n=1 Tax=Nezara viridula TaxID=85310 RepID=A0A9P0MU13_NEZVI|nr:unnamed protein product [Nezara viridula]